MFYKMIPMTKENDWEVVFGLWILARERKRKKKEKLNSHDVMIKSSQNRFY